MTSKERDGETTPRGGTAAAREGMKSSDKDKESDHTSNQSAAEAKIISDELKTSMKDAKSCKFCHVVPPRKKVKYPNQVPNHSNHGRPTHN